MKTKKLINLAALALALLLPVMALAQADFGAAALTEGKTYTLDEMLTYAIQDEYLAQAEYRLVMETLGQERPFVNIEKAEGNHIAQLLPLFSAHNVPVPENTAPALVVKPESLQAAYEAEVITEKNNIAMYETFLKQDNLPDDVRLVFERLMRASGNHLRAFERSAAGEVMGPRGQGRGTQGRGAWGQDDAFQGGRGRRNNGGNAQTCAGCPCRGN